MLRSRGETIRSLEICKVIARYGTGHDNIDVDAAREKRIVVTAVVDYATDEVADHAMALVLALNRALVPMRHSVVSGGWTPHPLPPMPRPRGSTIGLFGCGRIGSAIVRRARAFGMNVLAYAESLPDGADRADTLRDLLEASDVLSLHAPLTPETAGALGRSEFGLLPRGALVVSVARGGLLDLEAAVHLLDSGALGGLDLDVTNVEPLPEDHPARNNPRILLTPHVAYYSDGSVIDAKERSAGEIVRVVSGSRPINPVFEP